MGRQRSHTGASPSGVSVLYDSKASIHVQLDEAERLVEEGRWESADPPGSRTGTSRYVELRRLHQAREVLDWFLSPRGMSRLYKSKEPSLDVFVRMWSLLGRVLVCCVGLSDARPGPGEGVGTGAWRVDESFAPMRTLPVVASRMAEVFRLYGEGGSTGDDLPFEAYGVLGDVVDVLCAGVRAGVFVVQAEVAFALLGGASRGIRQLGGGSGVRQSFQSMADRGPVVRFAALIGEFFVLQMGHGRWEPGKMKREVVEGVSHGAFYDGGGLHGDALRASCQDVLRWALFQDADGTKEMDVTSLTSWAGAPGAHPCLVSWMIEACPSGRVVSSGAATPGGPSVSDVFFGCADFYVAKRDVDGISRLLESLSARGAELYRTVGDDGPALFARLTGISDFLMAHAGSHIVPAMKGLDCIVAVEHRGIEEQIDAYWSLMGVLGDQDKTALCRSLDVLFSEYNRLRRLDVLFESINFADMTSRAAGSSSKPWSVVVGSPVAMATVRRALRRVPAAQSAHFVDLVGAWLALSHDTVHEVVSEMACVVLESVPIDLNNALQVARHTRQVLEGGEPPKRRARKRDVPIPREISMGRNDLRTLLGSCSALAVVTKLLDVHDRCCRIDPNIAPVERDIPEDNIKSMVTSVTSRAKKSPRETQGMGWTSMVRSLVAGIVYHLKAECEAASRSRSRVTERDRGEPQGGTGAKSQGRASKRQKSEGGKTSAISFLVTSLSDVMTAVGSASPRVHMDDLLDTGDWWFDMAIQHLGGPQREALVHTLLQKSSPVRSGQAFCMRHVDVVIDMGPGREETASGSLVPIFAEDVDPDAVVAHYELLAPSIGMCRPDILGGTATINAVHELCIAHCAHALATYPRDACRVTRVVRDVIRQAKQSTDVAFDRVRSSVALLDMAMGSSPFIELEIPNTLDAVSIDATIKLGELVSNEVEACSMSSLATIIEEEDSVVASLMAIRGLIRAERSKSDATKRVICSTLVQTAREKLEAETIGDNLLTVAALSGAYSAALRAQLVSEEMLDLAPNVFNACISASRAAFDRNLASIVAIAAEFLETYVFIATSVKPRMSKDGASNLVNAALALLRDAPRGVGSGHVCRPNAPKEAMAIAASSFDDRGESRRHILRVLAEMIAGSTRDECTALLDLALSNVSLEHAELLLLMLEDSANGVLRDLLNNQVDNIVFCLVEALEGLHEASSAGKLANGNGVTDEPVDATSRQLMAVTILRCLESVVCRPTRFIKLPRRAIGTILSTVQRMPGRFAETPGNETNACFDGVCQLVRGILRHQVVAVGRYLHLVAGVIAALQSALALDFLMRGDAPAHLLEGLSRVLEEFSKIRAVQPYLKDALLTHIKLFMSPVVRSTLDECLTSGLSQRVPEDRIGKAVVPVDAQRLLSPGIAAVYGSCSEHDIQDVYSCLASRSHAGEWRLRLEDLRALYESDFKFEGKV